MGSIINFRMGILWEIVEHCSVVDGGVLGNRDVVQRYEGNQPLCGVFGL